MKKLLNNGMSKILITIVVICLIIAATVLAALGHDSGAIWALIITALGLLTGQHIASKNGEEG